MSKTTNVPSGNAAIAERCIPKDMALEARWLPHNQNLTFRRKGIMNRGKKQSGQPEMPKWAAATGLAMLFWSAQAFAGGSPYRVPPAEGPWLVGLDMTPKPVPIHVKTLCRNEELIAFSCTLQNKKIVSLCASADIGKESGYLQYRYGRDSSSVELEYPKEKSLPQTSFKQVSDWAPKGSASAVSFWVGSYRYSLFLRATAYDYPDIAGVVVDRDEKMASFHQCINKSVVFTFAPGAPLDGFGLSGLGLPPAGDDISYAKLWTDGTEGLTGAQAITVGSAKHPIAGQGQQK